MNGACKCLQELGILYPEKLKIVTPQMMPKIPPEDFVFRGPPKGLSKFGNYGRGGGNLMPIYSSIFSQMDMGFGLKTAKS